MLGRTPKWTFITLCLALAVAMLAVVAACGGDDTSGSTTASPNGTTQASNNGGSSSTAAATGNATAAPTDNGSTTDPLAQLEQLGNDIKQVTGKVTYTETDTEAGGTPTTSMLTFYSKDSNSRFDFTDSDGSLTTEIQTTDTIYICTDSDQTCLSEPVSSSSDLGGLAVFGAFFNGQAIDALVSEAQAQGIQITKSSQTINGEDATCYSGTDPSDNSTGDFCFDSDGLLLQANDTEADGSTTAFTATSRSTDVSDSDFTPPYPVTTFPVIPTG